MAINLPSSKPQANVVTFLEAFRKLYLQQALSNAIAAADLRAINAELDRLAPAEDLDDLALLTLGPQLRGSNNTRIGAVANRAVFEIIQQIVKHAIVNATESRLEIVNASRRNVVIAFSADPDISIFEEMPTGARNVVAIEIKGGADASNIWNRLGEAEKSHQSAKHRGFVEFWTIYNVPNLNLGKARVKSPTTNRFYSLIELSSTVSAEFADFRDRLLSLVGIAAPRKRRGPRARL